MESYSKRVLNFKLLSLGILFLCLNLPVFSQNPEFVEVMKSYRNAFNRGDIGMMIELMHKDYKGYYIGKDTIESAFSNFENFRNDMSNYFDMYPDVHSTFMSMTEEEGNIIVTEEVEWTGKKGKRKQSSLAIYQLKDDLIFRSYYFVD